MQNGELHSNTFKMVSNFHKTFHGHFFYTAYPIGSNIWYMYKPTILASEPASFWGRGVRLSFDSFTSRIYISFFRSWLVFLRKICTRSSVSYHPSILTAKFHRIDPFWDNTKPTSFFVSWVHEPILPTSCSRDPPKNLALQRPFPWGVESLLQWLHPAAAEISLTEAISLEGPGTNFLHPRKLTCPLKINGWKMYSLLK